MNANAASAGWHREPSLVINTPIANLNSTVPVGTGLLVLTALRTIAPRMPV
jgi:hypothetical protein